MSEFIVPLYRLARRSGRDVRLIPGQSWTIVDDRTEYLHPIRREMSRDVLETLYPNERVIPESVPEAVDDEPMEEEEETPEEEEEA